MKMKTAAASNAAAQIRGDRKDCGSAGMPFTFVSSVSSGGRFTPPRR